MNFDDMNFDDMNFYIPGISTIYWFILGIFVGNISLQKRFIGAPCPGIQPTDHDHILGDNTGDNTLFSHYLAPLN